MAIPNTVLVGYEDPYTHVIIENVRLFQYATGGVNVSVGELTRVTHAQVNAHAAGASGFSILSGYGPMEFHVTSGSGNIVTIGAWFKASVGAGEVTNGAPLSGYPLKVEAWGH